ncbi:unnamed protein product, partial [Rotaria magnacalcarata]
ANYSSGQSQFTTFGINATGTYQVQFSIITPRGIDSSFVTNINLRSDSSSITVVLPRITAKQDVDIDVISKNEIFNLTTAIVDQKSQ